MNAAAVRDVAGMALRNLGRHRAKTVITTVAVAVSVALYIFMDGWILGMNLESRRNIVAYEMGAAKIQTRAYFEKRDELPMYESFAGWEPLSAALAEAGYDSAPRFVFTGTLHSRAGTAPLLFNAVDPDRERRLLRYVPYLEAGRFPEDGRPELAVGTLAAERLRVGIPARPTLREFEEEILGAAAAEEDRAFVRSLYVPAPPPEPDRRPFSAPDPAAAAVEEGRMALRPDILREDLDRLWDLLAASGRMDVRISTVIDVKAADGSIRHVNQLIDAVVTGVVNSPNPKTNGNVAYVPLGALQDETGLMLEGAVTEILVRKAGADDARIPGRDEAPEAVRSGLEKALAARGAPFPDDLEVRGWKDYAQDYLAAAAGDDVSSRIMILLLFILSFIGISNTMLMAILERTKETGMLRALGMTDGQILLAYAMEAGLIGALGSAAGIVLGCLVNIPMVAHGIDYSAMAREMGGDFGYRIVALFRSAWNPPVIAEMGIAATLLSAAAAVPPTLRALRMPVTESLRFE